MQGLGFKNLLGLKLGGYSAVLVVGLRVEKPVRLEVVDLPPIWRLGLKLRAQGFSVECDKIEASGCG